MQLKNKRSKEQQIKKIERAIRKFGDPNGLLAKKLLEVKGEK